MGQEYRVVYWGFGCLGYVVRVGYPEFVIFTCLLLLLLYTIYDKSSPLTLLNFFPSSPPTQTIHPHHSIHSIHIHTSISSYPTQNKHKHTYSWIMHYGLCLCIMFMYYVLCILLFHKRQLYLYFCILFWVGFSIGLCLQDIGVILLFWGRICWI